MNEMKRLFVAVMSVGLLAAQGNTADLKAFLGVSDTQLGSIQQIRDTERKELLPLRQTVQAKAQALRDLRKAGSTDATALGQLMIDVQNARKQMVPIQTRAHDQAMSVLTPDQKTKLAQLETGNANLTATQRRALRQAARLGLLTPGYVVDKIKARRARKV
jgi:LTXXQ motif family protein